MLTVKSLHVIFMVTWFAGLFYLPRVFVYHAMASPDNDEQQATFRTMERKLLVMTHIGGGLTLLFGTLLLVIWLPAYLQQGWMHAKLALVACLIAYHLTCIKLVAELRTDPGRRSHKWYRAFNEIPVLFLFGVVFLVYLRPF